MVKFGRFLLFAALLFVSWAYAGAVDARFDLVGPRIDVRVTRGGDTLPIASVPNLQAGDKLWLHPNLPPTQSVKYLLICVFLRGSTNPPPDNWFFRIETWNKKIRQEGTFVTVPAEAQQALLFMAPETGGDFSTLKSAVQGRPGVFVRASQDLAEAGFEQARIEKYLASIRRVPPADPAALQKHSDLLARTLALKPNQDCFKRSPDTQFTCLTQTGTQTLLDDGHGQSIVTRLSTGPGSDFIQAASYTSVAGGGVYSAYVGAIVDLVRLMGNLHTAQYQYIPAIAFPQVEALNLRLNTPPSFHNPKSVLVIGLPSVQAAQPPPLRSANAAQVTCLLQPSAVLPIEGAPLVFSTAFANDLVLHLNTPPGAPAKPDIPLIPDAFQGGLLLQEEATPRAPLRTPAQISSSSPHSDAPTAAASARLSVEASQPEAVVTSATIRGRWGFDPFAGPTVQLQQLPGRDWHIVSPEGAEGPALIAGHTSQLYLASTGTACIHTVTAQPNGSDSRVALTFAPAPKPDQPDLVAVTLPREHNVRPGDLHLSIQQFGEPRADSLSTRTFAEPASISSIELPAHDRFLLLLGSHLEQIEKVAVGDLVYRASAAMDNDAPRGPGTPLRFSLPTNVPAPPTKAGDHLIARITLVDGRDISAPVIVSSPRPVLTLLRKSSQSDADTGITLTSPDDVPLAAHLTFTLKSPDPFPRNARIEVATVDGTLRTVLTLAPSGGLLLQDPRTVVATLEPLRSFGPSAFGPIHLRAVYPKAAPSQRDDQQPLATAADAPEAESLASDWVPLATLVRLPTLTHLQCPADGTQSCTLTGSSLFLIDSVSTDSLFTAPVTVPDGFTGSTLTMPHPAGSNIFLHLRDDPQVLATAVVVSSTGPQAASTHRSSSGQN